MIELSINGIFVTEGDAIIPLSVLLAIVQFTIDGALVVKSSK